MALSGVRRFREQSGPWRSEVFANHIIIYYRCELDSGERVCLVQLFTGENE